MSAVVVFSLKISVKTKKRSSLFESESQMYSRIRSALFLTEYIPFEYEKPINRVPGVPSTSTQKMVGLLVYIHHWS